MPYVKSSSGPIRGNQSKTGIIDTMFLVAVISICILFVPFIINILHAKVQDNERLLYVPGIYSLNTLIIIAGMRGLYYSKFFKGKDDYKNYIFSLATVFLSGILFLFLQFRNCMELFSGIQYLALKIFLVITVVHAGLYALVMCIWLFFLLQSIKIKSGADLYIYFLDHRKSALFKTTCYYWNFLGYLWIVTFLILSLKVMGIW